MATAKGIDGGTVLAIGAVGVGAYVAWQLFGPTPPPPPLVDPTLPPPTLTPAAARVLADRIFSAMYGSGQWGDPSGWDEDEEAVIAALIVPRNDNDVFLVIDEYGTRGAFWTVTGDMTLPQAVRHYLDPADIPRINMDYARRAINVRF